MSKLLKYDAVCRAIAEAKSVDEAKNIRDHATAVAVYARQAKNRDLEANCVEIRMRATRRLDQLRQAQAETVGLARGGEHGGRRGKGGVRKTPAIIRPTLAMQGIDKNLAKQARVLGALSDENFEAVVDDARGKVGRAVRNAVREVELEQERAGYRARTEQSCTVKDLEELAAGGFRAGVVCPDFPWSFKAYSRAGNQRSAEAHYETWPMERILAMGALIQRLAADDAALFLWVPWALLLDAQAVIESCGFKYKSSGFLWLKTVPTAERITLDGDGLYQGMGISGTRSNTECCLLGLRGSPQRLAKDVHQVVIAPVGEHSAKPNEVYRRIERLFPGPYLELFARRPREHWTCWGD